LPPIDGPESAARSFEALAHAPDLPDLLEGAQASLPLEALQEAAALPDAIDLAPPARAPAAPSSQDPLPTVGTDPAAVEAAPLTANDKPA